MSGTTRPVATWVGRRRLAAERSTFGAPVDRRAGQAPFFLVLASWLLGRAKFGCLQRQKPAMFAQMPLFVYRHFTGAVCTTSSDGRFALFRAPSTAAFSVASRLSNSSDILLHFAHLQSRPHCRRSPVARTRFKTLIYLKRFGAGASAFWCGGVRCLDKLNAIRCSAATDDNK